MDQQFENELEAAKTSFYKLQDNFNHNLLVIEELEEDNQRLITENEQLKKQYHRQIDELYAAMEALKDENKKLGAAVKSEVAKAKNMCEEETQHIVELMNDKMMEEKRFEAQKWARERKEAQAEMQKYQQSLKHQALENSKLNQLIKQLRVDKNSLQTELQSALGQKEAYSNKLGLHQRELENMRIANEEWEITLKDKIKEANKEKQRVEQELSETKLAFKLKLKSMKEEAAKKMEQLEAGKQKSLRLITQEAKQIKLRFDTTCQELEKLRAHAKVEQKEKARLEERLRELEKQAGSEKEMEYLRRMHEQEKIQLKGEAKLIQNERNSAREELKQVNEKRQEVEKSVQRLKTALLAAQKDIAEAQKKSKRLEKQIKELRNEAKRMAENTTINLRGYQKFEAEDVVNEQAVQQNQQNLEYSKYFSEDMGPADQMFFMENSAPRSPKVGGTGPSPVNHQLAKRIGELQVENEQLKQVVKTMSQEMQRAKSIFSDQAVMKDQQIKLGRDQIYLLREKINEREQQLLGLNSLRQQSQDNNRKISQLNIKIIQAQTEVNDKANKIKDLQAELVEVGQKCREQQQKFKDCQQEKNILDEINNELRAEIHQYKNRIRLYNESEEQSNRGEEQQFQEIRFQQSSNEDILKKSEQFRKGNRSRSRSDKKKPKTSLGLAQGSKTSIKLKDLVLKKKQLQMEGKKIRIDYKQPSTYKNIQKTGTESQKEVLEAIRRKSKSKGKERAEKLRTLDYDRLMGRNNNEDEQ